MLTGGAFALFSPAQAETGQADQSTVAQGRTLFLVGCASCHGKNGEGIVTERGTQYGPPLAGVGAASVDFQVGTGRMPLARPGVQAERKKVLYNPDEIKALAAYVASLSSSPGTSAAPARAALARVGHSSGRGLLVGARLALHRLGHEGTTAA